MSAPTTTPGHRERKKLATWRAIRTAALELFDASSFEAVSVEEIAAAAGISKTTYFNYFATKEAVVFDPDPEAPDAWSSLMAERPADEPLWSAVQLVVLGYCETYSDRIALHCRLKRESPAVADSARDMSDRFWGELRSWALLRPDAGDPLAIGVMLSCARAAITTAHDAWREDEPFERFIELARTCFAQLGRGFADEPPPP